MKHQTSMMTTMYTIKQYIQGAFLLLAGCCLYGCADEQLMDNEDENLAEVRFFTSAITRTESVGSAESLTDNARVRLYPYRQKTGVTQPSLIKDYTVTTTAENVQQLNPVVGSEGSQATAMILPSGEFTFYAVSTNSPTESVPSFDTDNAVNGVPNSTSGYAIVTNGIDYLYAKTTQTISFGTNTINVPLTFSHKGTQVQLTIKFGSKAFAENEEKATQFELADVRIQPTSEANAQIYLIDGRILISGNQTAGEPGSAKDSDLKSMTVVKSGNATGDIPATQIATYHLIPLKAAANRKMRVKVTVKNLKIGPEAAPATRIYTGSLDASSGWEAGKSNRYTLTLSGTEILFSPVTISPWVEGSSGEVGDLSNTEDKTTP